MVIDRDNFAVYDKNEVFELALFSTVGGREDQQDSAGYEIYGNGGIITICDGMGGQDGGKLASNYAVGHMLELIKNRDPSLPINKVLLDSADSIDMDISRFTFSDGSRMWAGTTMICAVIEGRNLYYVSVGDSRIYLSRGEELIRITTDHNYLMKLDLELSRGRITEEQYTEELPKSEALISFLGIGGLPIIDSSQTPLSLNKDDKLILTTDGLFKLIDESQIKEITDNFTNISDAVKALDQKAKRASAHEGVCRDNMTVAIIKIK